MQYKHTLSISDARKNFFAIADEVQSPDVHYTLTERGRPKAVIVSADRFESLMRQTSFALSGGASSVRVVTEPGFAVREMPGRKYGSKLGSKTLDESIFILREAPKVLYVDRKLTDDMHQAKELAKAQLYIELIEQYRYPLYMVEVGRCVKVGGDTGRRYTEADIIVSGYPSTLLLLFSVSAPAVYDEQKQSSIKELFELAEALSRNTKLTTRLVYYTRVYEKSKVRHRVMTIAYDEHPSYKAWVKAGTPSTDTIPMYDTSSDVSASE